MSKTTVVGTVTLIDYPAGCPAVGVSLAAAGYHSVGQAAAFEADGIKVTARGFAAWFACATWPVRAELTLEGEEITVARFTGRERDGE
jgi:hypothetical protein